MRRLLTLAIIVVLAGCAAPNTGSTPAASPTPVPQPSSTASIAASPSSSPAADTITVDHLARSTVDGLAVRAKAGTTSTQLGTINAGALGFVVAGPVSAGGYTWYQLAATGLPPNSGCEAPTQTTPFNCPNWLGWVAAGQPGGQGWLEASKQPCPASPMNLDALINETTAGPRTALERLACYGSSSIRIRAWWPQIPADAGLGGTCQANPQSVWWLECAGLNYNGLVVSESAGFGGLGIQISIDPASGVTMPPRGQWVEVVAHLDDPAARACAPLAGEDAVGIVLNCRVELVAESVKQALGPY